MAESVRRDQNEVYRRLRDAAAALAARAGVAGVCLVSGAGRLVMSFGSSPRPEGEDILARFVAAADLARSLDPDSDNAAPVFVHDGRNRVYVRPLTYDLSLLLCCETRLPPGMAYRLVETPAAHMREALDDLFGEADRPVDKDAGPPGADDIFWE